MSKNIKIQEGGVAKSFTASKLRTDLVSGGTCEWIPEDEANLITKSITKNGTYKASDDNAYGYSEVTVSGIGVAKGKDGDGDNAVSYTDPDTGDLVTEKEIESIDIVTEPTTLEYQDGDTIDFTGLSVHGYSSTGTDLGDITDDCMLTVTTADYDAGTGSSKVTVEGLTSPVYIQAVHEGDYIEPDYWVVDQSLRMVNIAHYISNMVGTASVICIYSGNGDQWGMVFVSNEYFKITHQRQCPPGWSPQITDVRSSEYSYGGYTGYVSAPFLRSDTCKFRITAEQEIEMRDTAILAYFAGVPVGVIQEIPVVYRREYDYEVLRDSFSISVTR